MEKDSHRPTRPPERILHSALAVIAITTFSACSQPPENPSSVAIPTAVTGNSAQFPNIKDRPLTNQTLVPTPTPIPRPTEKPTPTPTIKKETSSSNISSPEKGIINPIILLPIKVEEKNVSPGWKSVSMGFVAENRSNKTMLILLDPYNFGDSVLKSQEGFSYKNTDHFSDNGICFGSFASPYEETTVQKLRSSLSPELLKIISKGPGFHEFNSIPPHFRTRGIFRISVNGVCNEKSVNFTVGEKTSGYKLNVPNFPEIDLHKDAISLDQLKFPTDRPDSDFKNPGTTISIPGKGSVTFEGVVGKTPNVDYSLYTLPIEKRGTMVKLRFRFHNDNIGYGQQFNLATKLFGDDGILYTTTSMSESLIKAFPNQPLYWDGYFVQAYEVAPGNDATVEVSILTSYNVKGGKLAVSGDINEIFNLQLPTPR